MEAGRCGCGAPNERTEKVRLRYCTELASANLHCYNSSMTKSEAVKSYMIRRSIRTASGYTESDQYPWVPAEKVASIEAEMRQDAITDFGPDVKITITKEPMS